MPKFPFQAKLIKEPGSEWAQFTMTVGNTYTVYGMAGCCWEVSTDLFGDKTIINPCWFEAVKE